MPTIEQNVLNKVEVVSDSLMESLSGSTVITPSTKVLRVTKRRLNVMQPIAEDPAKPPQKLTLTWISLGRVS